MAVGEAPPVTDDFLADTAEEARFQLEHWGEAHDADKDDSSWFWTLGHIIGKVIHDPTQDVRKLRHRLRAGAALLLNWDRHVAARNGQGARMDRPGEPLETPVTAVERAAEVVADYLRRAPVPGVPSIKGSMPGREIAQALADAGLLAVDWDEELAEYRKYFRLQRAVIEAAKRWRRGIGRNLATSQASLWRSAASEIALAHEVDALLEADGS